MKLLLVVVLLTLAACAPTRSHVNFATESESTAPPAETTPEPAPADDRATDEEIDLGLSGAPAATISVVAGDAAAPSSDEEGEESEDGEEGEEDEGEAPKVKPPQGEAAPAADPAAADAPAENESE